MAYRKTSFAELGGGFLRSVRKPLGVTAFGANALVLPRGTEWFDHYHDEQDELYFVHRGRAGFRADGDVFELGPGGVCYVEAASPRQVWNAGDEELVVLIVGGRDGYIGRDGRLVDPADLERRRAAADGDLEAVRRDR
jgi:quercetin dioxygenase-like cupin family protein